MRMSNSSSSSCVGLLLGCSRVSRGRLPWGASREPGRENSLNLHSASLPPPSTLFIVKIHPPSRRRSQCTPTRAVRRFHRVFCRNPCPEAPVEALSPSS
ncbi:uncharacterized protein BDR25DRAFT_129149 [Lindgomyces ingoldianus]|uniref:Uncharacterized protein n=1 Tax=Lindgomyces ingoldianus TaxID=673940 RepID=A0ACB6R221_9PLEO|nr:uncharacterized protein BDR25DRAFT_129149 [Lindgomyces ingoldianus]KAF2473145.1 hypothetical protein BDR25DRAFT_129149 [Lindgomyces ingoldianus]